MKKVILSIIILLFVSSFIAYGQQIRVTTTTRTAMTAPGNSTAVGISNQVYSKVTWYYTLASVDTNVIVALQAKVGSHAWTTIETTVTKTANGNYGLTWSNTATA